MISNTQFNLIYVIGNFLSPLFIHPWFLVVLRRYRGRSVALNYLYSKSLDWFLYDKDLRHERIDEQFPEQFKWCTSYHLN